LGRGKEDPARWEKRRGRSGVVDQFQLRRGEGKDEMCETESVVWGVDSEREVPVILRVGLAGVGGYIMSSRYTSVKV
jgi:hypothetical protein